MSTPMPTFASSAELYAIVVPFLKPAFVEYRGYLDRSGHSALL